MTQLPEAVRRIVLLSAIAAIFVPASAARGPVCLATPEPVSGPTPVVAPDADGSWLPGGLVALSAAPDPGQREAYAALQARRAGYGPELRRLRARYFRSGSERGRAIGLARLRSYTDPAAYELLGDLFFGEGPAVRDAVLEHFAKQGTPEGDAALAWEAVYGDRERDREAALAKLGEVVEDRGMSTLVEDVIRNGLSERSDETAVAAGQAAAGLRLYELIPLIASAQVAAQGTGDRRGDLGWIFIGQQTSFIADVQPVVSDSAVAFDPQLGVVSEGVILRVSQAFVAEYRVELNSILMGMASEAWGRSVTHLGYDVPAWHRWYEDEFEPFMAEKPGGGPDQP